MSEQRDATGRGRGFGKPFAKGRSGNPNGPPHLKNDLRRAATLGLLPELHCVLDEWKELAEEKLARMGATAFIATLQAEIKQACELDIPPTPEVARAMWWRAGLVRFAEGAHSERDSVWTHLHHEIGLRLLGKPKDHIVIEDGAESSSPIDWEKVPADRRPVLGNALLELQGYLTEPTATEH